MRQVGLVDVSGPDIFLTALHPFDIVIHGLSGNRRTDQPLDAGFPTGFRTLSRWIEKVCAEGFQPVQPFGKQLFAILAGESIPGRREYQMQRLPVMVDGAHEVEESQLDVRQVQVIESLVGKRFVLTNEIVAYIAHRPSDERRKIFRRGQCRVRQQ